MSTDNSNKGHRQRLRERFLKGGLAGFHDYEIVELLLTLGTPRKDCKQPAKEAIKRFKNLRGVLTAPAEELEQIPGIGRNNTICLRVLRGVTERFLKERLIARPAHSSAKEIFDYLYHSMRDLKKEVFKVIYLDSQNQIIEVNDIAQGTINASTVYPREVIGAAVKCGATSLIFVHNHPSGNPEPSANDRALTRDLVYAGSIMLIKVLDHIIIGNNVYYTFAGEGLIDEYETDFLDLKTRGTAEAKRRLYKAKTATPALPWTEKETK